MYYDALTLAAVAAEFHQTILGGRVQRVVQSGPLSIGLELYARHRRFQLVASADPQHARVHLSEAKVTRDPQARSPFLLHLRKRLRGAILQEIERPPLERILHLRFYHHRLSPEEQINTLVIETMGRYSNLILIDQQEIVLDCVKRVTPQMSPARPMLPQQRYEPPPPQIKADPRRVTVEGLRRALAGLDPGLSLQRALVNLYRGVSPLLAREIVHRTCGDVGISLADDYDPDRLAETLATFWSLPQSDGWEPCLAIEDGRPAAYAPYLLTHRPEWQIEPMPTTNQALNRYYAQQQPLTDHHQMRQRLQEAIEQHREKLETRLDTLDEELARADQVQALRRKGEWLLAFQHLVSPGQTLLEVEGLAIELDPQRSPVENAQAYFAQYRKAKQARRTLPYRIEETKQSLAWLEEMDTLLEIAEDYDDLASLARELEKARVLTRPSGPPHRKSALPPRTFYSEDGFTILVGRNARQNETITFNRAQPYDLWLHARDRPGAHVVLITGGEPVPPRTLEQAAALAAYYSQGRHETKVNVDYTECRYVRRAAPSRPGLVRYDHQKTLIVVPERPADLLRS